MSELEVVSWNVENLARVVGELPSIHRALRSPAVLCLQEIRVRPQDRELVEAMTRALPGFDCHYSLCDDPRNVTFRGGRMYGVVTWVRRDLDSVGATLAWDREGRVVVSDIPKLRLTIVNVYAVNGTGKPYFDHELGRIDGDRHAFKRRFVERLAESVRPLVERGSRLVMVGDWNVSRTKADTVPRLRTEEPHALARKLFNERFIPSLDVVDVFRELHPTARKYTWHSRRSRPEKLDAARVDYALVSRSLMPDVLAADIDESPEARFGSDHAPLFVRLQSA